MGQQAHRPQGGACGWRAHRTVEASTATVKEVRGLRGGCRREGVGGFGGGAHKGLRSSSCDFDFCFPGVRAVGGHLH